MLGLGVGFNIISGVRQLSTINSS